MPILLTRKNGPPTPFRNVEYLPLYYFIPKRILEQCGHELNSIPRIPKLVFADRNACNIIESDLFVNLIIDAVAYMVWPHMGFKEYMEIYSGYDPAWILAHSPAFWVQELLDSKILPTANDLYEKGFEYFGYMPEGEITEILNWLVPHVMEKHNMQAAIETAKEFRCFEDFDFRKSTQKTDFHRKWYHTRTKHPMVSLDSLKEDYEKSLNGQEWDLPDYSQDVEESATSEVLVERFIATLSEKDKAILKMRMEGDTLEEIAKELGYKNHSGVLKRIRKIGQAFEKFIGEDYGFTDSKII